ncbi:MAG: restriction endonuclease [Vicinamibacterales bacterium]
MTRDEFERVLDQLRDRLRVEIRAELALHEPKAFENRVRTVLQQLLPAITVDLSPHPHEFPDVVVGQFGIEVKFCRQDSWRSVANSVFESTRAASVQHIYLLFGKIGGVPDVGWGRYENCVMHVRTSHVPRFEVELDAGVPLFEQFKTTYDEFRGLTEPEKMKLIRRYARSRIKPGTERPWWLGDDIDDQHAVPLTVRIYMSLPDAEKRKCRAEAALLCPQIVQGSRSRTKYADAVMYLLTYRGVLCPQARDLFTAGSVAGPKRGGLYMPRALKDIEPEMMQAAAELDDELFVEYWGESVPKEQRIANWLARADSHAKAKAKASAKAKAEMWVPSEVLFRDQH